MTKPLTLLELTDRLHEMQGELDVQTKRIAQMQAELDVLPTARRRRALLLRGVLKQDAAHTGNGRHH